MSRSSGLELVLEEIECSLARSYRGIICRNLAFQIFYMQLCIIVGISFGFIVRGMFLLLKKGFKI